MTNVKPNELNYDHYTTTKYDSDIINSIPHHKELHQRIDKFIRAKFKKSENLDIVEFGPGTGLTTQIVKNALPEAKLDLVDFSRQMIAGAKKRLGNKKIKYIFGDYSKLEFSNKYDVAISVIGIHHQSNNDKVKLFRKIYSLLKPNGIFIFGDLVTYRDKKRAAYNNALHFHHLVEHTTDQKTLEEWAYHHQYLNILAPIEDQTSWLRKVGFKVSVLLSEKNTALLICEK